MFHLLSDTVRARSGGLYISNGVEGHVTRQIPYWELIYVTSGTLHMFEDDNEFHVGAGQALILQPFHTHGGLSDYDRNLRFYWFHFFATATQDETEEKHLSVPRLCCPSRPAGILDPLQQFLADRAQGRRNENMECAVALLLLSELEEFGMPFTKNGHSALAVEARTYIQANFNRPIHTSSIARALNYNADYLERLYRRCYGCTITDDIKRNRIRHAIFLLSESNATVREITEQSGFASQSDFCRSFKKITGMTPSAYRQSAQSGR